jgi:signal transduction histidine kinase
MRLTRSTTFRIAALIFLLQLLGVGITLGTVRWVTRNRIHAGAHAAARLLREEMLGDYRAGGLPMLIKAVAARTDGSVDTGAVMLLTDAAGKPLAGNIGAWPPDVELTAQDRLTDLYRIGHPAPERMRVSTLTLPQGEHLLIGRVVDRELRVARIMENAMLSTVALAVALAGFAAWVSARLIEGRIGAMVRTARAVSTGAFHQRVPVDDSGDGFERLALAMNAMLDRIEGLMTELQLANDSLAHDLRSPLTRMKASLDRAWAATAEPGARDAIGRALEEGDRLLGILNMALRIGRAEAGVGRDAFAPVDLGLLLSDMAEVYGPVAEDSGRRVIVAAPEGLVVPVHREMLNQALANLLDNALAYGAGDIGLTARAAGEEVCITVWDQGQGIAPALRAEAMRRFGRLDAARPEGGAGLGLALARAVAHLHGGDLTLGDNHPGLAVRLTLGTGARA